MYIYIHYTFIYIYVFKHVSTLIMLNFNLGAMQLLDFINMLATFLSVIFNTKYDVQVGQKIPNIMFSIRLWKVSSTLPYWLSVPIVQQVYKPSGSQRADPTIDYEACAVQYINRGHATSGLHCPVLPVDVVVQVYALHLYINR